ncbi:MAG: hypothetical protein RJA70_39 [Pseudomonadota bacterium]
METLTAHLTRELEGLEARSLLRDPADPSARVAERAASSLGLPVLNASGNDYLALSDPRDDNAAKPVSRETALGAGASRLIHGTRPEHRALEQALEDWLPAPAVLLFSSGYAANVGLLTALATHEDLIVSDELNHASVIDGCRLSRATVRRYRHLDTQDARAQLGPGTFRRRWLITESYFSMDGDSPDLADLAEAARPHGAALLVDEAHALGVFGPRGAGLCAAQRVTPDALLGTFGKAFGGQGAFVAGSSALRTWLWNRARSFMYSTAPSPRLAHGLQQQLERLARADAERAHLLAICARFSQAIPSGLTTAGRHGPIFPLLCGTPRAAQAAANEFLSRGILVQAIRPPTVPEDGCRLRLTLSASFTWNDVERLEEALLGALRHL